MRGTGNVFEQDTALCRDLIVYMEISLFFFLQQPGNRVGSYTVLTQLQNYAVMSLYLPHCPYHNPKGSKVTIATSRDPHNLPPPGKCSISHSLHVAFLLGRVPGAGPTFHEIFLCLVLLCQPEWISWSRAVLQAPPQTHRPWIQTVQQTWLESWIS